MEKIKFSIICPIYIYKKEGHLVAQECLDSVLRYSHDYELIIVDDASPLYTGDLLSQADIVIKHNKNKGLAPSWNDGLKIARGDYLVAINSDIEVCEGWLDEMKKAMDTLEGDICGPSVEHLPNDPTQPGYQWFPGSCFMLKRKTIETIGYFDESFAPFNYEDLDYWTRILKAGLRMVRAYNVFIKHKEGITVHSLNYKEQDKINKQKFIKKWGFDPIPVFCGGEEFPTWL